MKTDLYDQYTSTSTSFSLEDKGLLESYYALYSTIIAPILPQDTSVPILDIACGWGGLLSVLQKEGYQESYGFDVSQEQIDQARQLGVDNVQVSDILEYVDSCQKESFQVILLIDILEHLPVSELVTVMKRLKEILRPEGTIIIQVPNGACLVSLNFYSDLTHYRAFTSISLTQLARMSGLTPNSYQEVLPNLPTRKRRWLSRGAWYGLIKPFTYLYMLATVGNNGGGVYTPNIVGYWRKK